LRNCCQLTNNSEFIIDKYIVELLQHYCQKNNIVFVIDERFYKFDISSIYLNPDIIILDNNNMDDDIYVKDILIDDLSKE